MKMIFKNLLLLVAVFFFSFTQEIYSQTSSITLTTKKEKGETLSLDIDTEIEDVDDIWIDLNGNNVKDSGEEVAKKGGTISYTVDKEKITIYGDVTYFNCTDNELTSLDTSKNLNLNSLYCGSNRLSSLDVSKNINLTNLGCGSNKLTSLDVSKNVNLTSLSCGTNQLPSLNVSKNVNLKALFCRSNKLTSLDVFKNVKLTHLGCGSNKLTSLDVFKNINLEYLDCDDSQLVSLDVSKNINLTHLSCNGNQLPSLDVFKNVKLTHLGCESNKLNSLDVSKNINLRYLNCRYNQLTSLDVFKNINLTILVCNSNKLSSLDISKNIDLTNLYCGYNKLTSLDVSKNINLTYLGCGYNQLTKLDVSNKNNTNFTYLNAIYNPNLRCIKLDKGFIPTTTSEKKWEKDDSSIWKNDGSECPEISVTAVNMIESVSIKLGKSKILQPVIVPFTATNQSILWSSSNTAIAVVDKRGIVTAKSVGVVDITTTTIDGGKKAICKVNVIPNVVDVLTLITKKEKGATLNLKIDAAIADRPNVWIDFNNNGLKDKGEKVTKFDEATNYIIDKQKITIYGDLTSFDCSNNRITSLDVSKSLILKSLDCRVNPLTELDVSKNIVLENLNCRSNGLTILDVSNNVALVNLDCDFNELTNLDVSKNIFLENLNCRYNNLASLDVSNNTALTSLSCNSNQLTSLNASNGSNKNFNSFKSKGNKNLRCIKLDKGFTPATASDKTWEKDDTSIWKNDGTDCPKIAVENISIVKNLSLEVGKNKHLTPTISPVTATNQSVKWSSGNTKIATVDKNGNVIAKSVGTADIIVTTVDGDKKAICKVKVVPLFNPRGINISWKSPTCTDKSNGVIIIKSTTKDLFDIEITGEKGFSFKAINSKTIENLRGGVYNITLRYSNGTGENIAEYSIKIPQAPKVAAKISNVNNAERSAHIKTSGDSEYTVYLNKKEVDKVAFSNFDVSQIIPIHNLNIGENHIKIVPKNHCRGVIEKWITIKGNVKYYPNPTKNHVYIKGINSSKVSITIATMQGSIVYRKTLKVVSGTLQFSIGDLPSNVYLTNLLLDNNEFINLKIIKE